MGNSNQNIADIEGDDGGTNGYALATHLDLVGRITNKGSGTKGDHSTRIAGLLVANHNTIGIAGINKYAHLNTYLFSSGDNDEWADKILDARLDGNKVINISQGTYDGVPNIYLQLAEAYSNNIVTVVSVGNTSINISNPANFQSVIAVGSSTKDNTSSSWSNSGPQIEFLAPGGTDFTLTNPKNIYSTSSNGSYNYKSGTSYAAPIVSAAASLLLAYKPDLTNEDVKNILIQSCDKLEEMNGANFNNKCGYGRINLKKAMELLETPYSLTHGNATLTQVHDNVAQIFLAGNPVLAAGTYYVDVYKLSVDQDNLQYLVPPLAWLPTGYSAANPNNSQEYEVITTTSTSVHAYTYFYYVRTNSQSQPINLWFPYNPPANYTILGKSAIINVPQEYSTISAALAAAVPGQTVSVTGSQSIISDLSIPSGITLKINSGAILTFSSNKKLNVNSGGTLTANGATFRGNGTAGNWHSIWFSANSSGSIQGCTIKDAQCGVYTTTNANVTVSNSTITNNSLYGFSVISNSNINITGCTISNNNNKGINVASANATIANNTISNNGTGIYLSSSNVDISGNTILNSTSYGINANNVSSSFYWHNNNLHGNGYAMLLTNASPWIGHCDISDNSHGVVMNSSSASFAVPPSEDNQMLGYNAITCNSATPNFKAENYSTIYAGYGYNGGYNSIFGSELPDMEAANHSGIYACNNYWGSPYPAISADGTSWILAWYPLTSDPNPGSCSGLNKSLAKSGGNVEAVSNDISNNYWDAISKMYGKDLYTAKDIFTSIINENYDSKYSPLALLALYEMKLKVGKDNSSLNEGVKNLLTAKYNASEKDMLRPFAIRLLARDAALSNNFEYMVSYNTELVNKYPNTNNELAALYDLVTYYIDMKEDFTKAKEYYSRMTEAYPDEDLTRFAAINLGEDLGIIKKGLSINNDQTPKEYFLSNAYPNPFNPTTEIKYAIKEDGLVSLKVYDMLGREMATLVNENKSAGTYTVNFDAKNLSSGVYLYSISAGNFQQTKKMILTK